MRCIASILHMVKAKSITILSIDGGGMRALIPALLLAEIERRTGIAAGRLFDLVAGISAGGVVALGVASTDRTGTPHTAGEVVEFFRRFGQRIFRRPLLHRMLTMGGIWGPFYPSSGLLESLRAFFSEAMLGDALRELLIPTYDLTLHQPYFFTRDRARCYPDENLPIYQALYAAFAVPAFFSPLVVSRNTPQRTHLLADGGLFMSNPVLAAFFEARRRFPAADDVLVVSFGTGRLAWPMMSKNLSLPQWLTPAESIQSDGQKDMANSYLRDVCSILGEKSHRFVRLDPWVLPEEHSPVDASEAHQMWLTRVAEELIRQNDELLNNLCAELSERAGPDAEYPLAA